MKLLMSRVLALLVSLTMIGGLVYASTGLFHHHSPEASSTWWEPGVGTVAQKKSGVPPDGTWPATWPAPPKGIPVLSNSCSAGYVTFTFDDGPDKHTLALASELKAEHVPAVFFEIGEKVTENPGITRELVKQGFVIGDHSYTHESLTGVTTKTEPLTGNQARIELTRTISAIVAAGAPRPTLWRPPYSDVNKTDQEVGNSLGMQLVLSSSIDGTITDNADWTGASAATIATIVTTGKPSTDSTPTVSPMHNGSIIAGHDGTSGVTVLNTIASIPLIVNYMNAHALCATGKIPANATGGVFARNSDINSGQ